VRFARTAAVFAAILAMILWLVVQTGLIGTLERQNNAMRKRLAVSPIAVVPRPRRPVGTCAMDERPIDWEDVSRQIQCDPGIGYLRTTLRLDEAIRSMSFGELVAALEEIEASDLSACYRYALMKIICTAVFEKAPMRGLKHFIHRYYNDSLWMRPMGRALADWARRDPKEASAWFAEQFASGKFDARSFDGGIAFPTELSREAVFSLLGPAPEAAKQLLAAIPQNKRRDVLASMRLNDLAENEYSGWAAVVRSVLPKPWRTEAIAWPIYNWSDGDGSPMKLAELDRYLESIRPGDAELEFCILKAASIERCWHDPRDKTKSLANDLAAMRTWVAARAPDLVGPATAEALADVCPRLPYSEQAALALRFQQADGNDAYLVPLLEKDAAFANKKTARSLARRLFDPTLRETYLKRLK